MSGNRYLSRQVMIHSGRFWRCRHGFTNAAVYSGICWKCALRRPITALRYHLKNGVEK